MWQTLTTFLVVSLVGLFGACESSTGSQPIDSTDTINQSDTDNTSDTLCDGKPDNPYCTNDVLVNDSTETDTIITTDYCEPFAVINGDWYNASGELATVSYSQVPPRVCEVRIEGPGAEIHGGVFTDVYGLPIVAADEGTRLEVGLTEEGRLYQRWYDGAILEQEYYYSRTPPSAN